MSFGSCGVIQRAVCGEEDAYPASLRSNCLNLFIGQVAALRMCLEVLHHGAGASPPVYRGL